MEKLRLFPVFNYSLSPELSTVFFDVDEKFRNVAIPQDNQKNYFVLALIQELEKFHYNKKPQSAYLNTIMRRLTMAEEQFNIANEKENYRNALTQLSKEFENNYFLDQVYFQLGIEYTELGNAEKHSSHYKTAVNLLQKAIQEAEKHKKAKNLMTDLIDNIKAPYALVSTENHILPNKPILAKVTFKNLQNNQKEHFIYYKIYKHAVNGIKSYNNAQQVSIDSNLLNKCVTHKIKLFNLKDFNEYSTFIELPAMQSGYYSLIVSSKENFNKEQKAGRLGECFLKINAIQSAITLVEKGDGEITVKNSLSGAPIANAQIKTYNYEYYNKKYKLIQNVKTDSNGIAKIANHSYNNFAYSVETGNEIAVYNDDVYFQKSRENTNEINKIFTDSPVRFWVGLLVNKKKVLVKQGFLYFQRVWNGRHKIDY